MTPEAKAFVTKLKAVSDKVNALDTELGAVKSELAQIQAGLKAEAKKAGVKSTNWLDQFFGEKPQDAEDESNDTD